MPTIKSLDELKRIREEALKKREIKTAASRVQIVVGMGTPGIAAGARDTLKEFLSIIEEKELTDVTVRQTGNFGLDSLEPVVLEGKLAVLEKDPYGLFYRVTDAVPQP